MSGSATWRWMRALGQVGREARLFAQALGDPRERSTHILVIGVPDFEPWHFTAHLAEQATRHGRHDLVPTLLRWSVPAGAPSHLAVSVDAMTAASRTQTVLAITPYGVAPELLERVADAKRRGARIMTLHRGQADLIGLSHETLSVDPLRPGEDFEVTQHLVSDLTPTSGGGKSPNRRRRGGVAVDLSLV